MDKYDEIVEKYCNYNLEWDKLKNKNIMISGVTGLVGKFFVDLIMKKNLLYNLNCTIVGLCRNYDDAIKYFDKKISENLIIIGHDVLEPINYKNRVDYVIHAASNTHPIQYATDPIGTIKTNVYGTNNLLEYSVKNEINKFILISSFEVYGTVDDKIICEDDYGVVNPLLLRSCYPESKRMSENLTIAYSNQKNIDTSIVRLSRVFGPTMKLSSSLATAQFIKSVVDDKDIVLKSDGMQLYSYNYVGDAVTAILEVLINGKNMEAYNVSDDHYNLRLKEFAEIVANIGNRKVLFDLPSDVERKGYSNLIMSVLDNSRIKSLGWMPLGTITDDVKDTIQVMKLKKQK